MNGSPVLLTPIRVRTVSRPSSWLTRAKTNGFETDWIENGWSASPTAYTAPLTCATAMPKSSGSTSASSGM